MMFASKTLLEHLVRGVIGFGAVILAINLARAPDLLGQGAALALVLSALVALRGCPICWTMGLFETLDRSRG